MQDVSTKRYVPSFFFQILPINLSYIYIPLVSFIFKWSLDFLLITFLSISLFMSFYLFQVQQRNDWGDFF